MQRTVVYDKSVLGYMEYRRDLDIKVKSFEYTKEPFLLLIIDIEDFGKFNKDYGFKLGELLLRMVSHGLLTYFPKNNIYKIGISQFSVLLNCYQYSNMDLLLEGLVTHVQSNIKMTFIQEKITLSLGISMFPEHAMTPADLIQKAEIALSLAKQNNHDKAFVYKDLLNDISSDYKDDLMALAKVLLSIINTKDNYTLEHSYRVAQYSLSLGNAIGLSQEEMTLLKYGALLHDIGKIEIPKEVLVKNTKLTNEEFELIRSHSTIGAKLIDGIEHIGLYKDIILSHHERIDGKGYPQGLKGNEIPLLARIVAICDSFDAMTSNRPYARRRKSVEALFELQICAGTQFDERLVKEFIKVM